MTEEKKTVELKDEDLERVSGGVLKGKVTDVVEGVIYKRKDKNEYAYVTGFAGVASAHVNYLKGIMQSDGKVHRLYYLLYEFSYTNFKNKFDLNNTLSADCWVDEPLY